MTDNIMDMLGQNSSNLEVSKKNENATNNEGPQSNEQSKVNIELKDNNTLEEIKAQQSQIIATQQKQQEEYEKEKITNIRQETLTQNLNEFAIEYNIGIAQAKLAFAKFHEENKGVDIVRPDIFKVTKKAIFEYVEEVGEHSQQVNIDVNQVNNPLAQTGKTFENLTDVEKDYYKANYAKTLARQHFIDEKLVGENQSQEIIDKTVQRVDAKRSRDRKV